MSEAICDAFYKGFEKCKKEVARAFNISNLDDIMADDLEGVRGGIDSLVQVIPPEVIEP